MQTGSVTDLRQSSGLILISDTKENGGGVEELHHSGHDKKGEIKVKKREKNWKRRGGKLGKGSSG